MTLRYGSFQAVPGSGSASAVNSVNGKTGDVLLTNDDLNAQKKTSALPVGTADINDEVAFQQGGVSLRTAIENLPISLATRQALLGKLDASQKGTANGVAELDASGKLPVNRLPDAALGGLAYQGGWNAATNTPALTSPALRGYYWVVTTAGSTNVGGVTDWQVGDWVISNGTAWQKIDQTDVVTSVNGKQGAVVLNAADVGAQPVDATLTALAGLVAAANKLAYFTGDDQMALADFTAFARTLLSSADAAAARTALDAQKSDATLTALAGLVAAANKLAYFTGDDQMALADFTAFARTLLSAADATAARTALGVGAQVSFDDSAFSDFNDAALFPYQARAVKRRSSEYQPSNRPLAASNYWSMETMSVSTGATNMYWLQRAYDLISGRLFQRVVSTADSGSTRTYGAWYELWSTQNLVKQTWALDTTAGAMLANGAWGLGTTAIDAGSDVSAAETRYARFMRILGTATGAPATDTSVGVVVLPIDGAPSSGLLAIGSRRAYIGHRAASGSVSWTEAWTKENMPYEQGTFTPSVYGITTAGTLTAPTRVGKYTRIGDTVFFYIRVTGTLSGAAGNLAVGALPFTVANDDVYEPASLIVAGIIPGAGKIPIAALQKATSFMLLFGFDPSAGTSANLSAAIAGTFTIQVAGSYKI